MKTFFKRLIVFAICFVLAILALRFAPVLLSRVGNATRLSERFSEALREKRELIVYEVEVSGQETVTRKAWLIGTVRKVVMPYTFSMRYSVDLSAAVVSAEGNAVKVSIPLPKAGYESLLVHEDEVLIDDWLYPLAASEYADIKQQTLERLFAEYAQNEENANHAWHSAVSAVQSLLGGVMAQGDSANAAVQISVVALEAAE